MVTLLNVEMAAPKDGFVLVSAGWTFPGQAAV
jgi:hypothetical protein